MLLIFAAGGLMGLLLGFMFPAPALIAASGMTAVVCLSVAASIGLEWATVVVMTFALLGVLQLGYLAGLALSGAWSRAKLSRSLYSLS
jgi:hypothetical protein